MSCLLYELTGSQLVAFATRSDTDSQNKLDLIQSLVPTHYVCNGYLLHMFLTKVYQHSTYNILQNANIVQIIYFQSGPHEWQH
jgi:hypothetical protein